MVPDTDDVVVRQKSGNPSTIYLVGTLATPEQYFVRTRDEAVAFAQRQRVRAWFAKGPDDFVLLGTFRKERKTQDEQSGVAERTTG